MAKIKNTELVCIECGSNKIEIKMWVNPNTYEIGDTTSDADIEDNWCSNCEAHTKLRTYKEYKDG